MPVYTVREVTGDAKPDSDLELRGLKARVVTMTQLDPIAVPDYPQIAYHLYSKLLPAFMLATKNQETFPTTRPGYAMTDAYKNCLPLDFPPLTVTFENKLSSEEIESLKSKGAAVIANKKEEQIKYTFGAKDVNMDLLSSLYKHKKKANHRCASPAGSVNLATIQAYMQVNAIFTWFMKTQSYPAFSGPSDTSKIDSSAFDTLEGFMSVKRKVAQGQSKKKARTDDEGEDSSELSDMDTDDDEKFAAIEEIMFGDSSSRVPKAKPSTPPPTIFGPVANMPTIPGLVFPYFEGLIASDTAYVASVLKNFFLECLGDTRSAIIAGFKDMKLYMGLLATTKPGRVLQHLAVGVSLAIGAQGRVYPIFEGGRYVGFTLHGWYFAITLDGYKIDPLPLEKLTTETASIDEHNVAIAKILSKMMKLKLIDGNKAPTKKFLQDSKATLGSPRALASLIRKFNLTDDQKDEIEVIATSLSFPQRFWPLDDKRILQAIDHLLAGTQLPDDAPMYIRGGTLTTSDVKLSTFAVFGDSAFSLRITGGESMKVPKDVASDVLFKPYQGKNGKEVVPKPTLIVAKKSLSLCLDDWSAFMSDHVFITKKSRDSIFRCVSLGGDRAKDFWYGLIHRIGPLESDKGRVIAAPEFETDSYDESGIDFWRLLVNSVAYIFS